MTVKHVFGSQVNEKRKKIVVMLLWKEKVLQRKSPMRSKHKLFDITKAIGLKVKVGILIQTLLNEKILLLY